MRRRHVHLEFASGLIEARYFRRSQRYDAAIMSAIGGNAEVRDLRLKRRP